MDTIRCSVTITELLGEIQEMVRSVLDICTATTVLVVATLLSSLVANLLEDVALLLLASVAEVLSLTRTLPSLALLRRFATPGGSRMPRRRSKRHSHSICGCSKHATPREGIWSRLLQCALWVVLDVGILENLKVAAVAQWTLHVSKLVLEGLGGWSWEQRLILIARHL